jgi:hypothetical protein
MVGEDVTFEVLDEAVGFAAFGGVWPYNETIDTDSPVLLDGIERHLARGGNSDLQRSERLRSTLRFGNVLQSLYQIVCLVHRREPSEPSGAHACGSGKRSWRMATDHDGGVRILYWRRELNLIVRRPTRPRPLPDFLHLRQGLVGSASSLGHGDAENRQLGFHMAYADTDDQPPLR